MASALVPPARKLRRLNMFIRQVLPESPPRSKRHAAHWQVTLLREELMRRPPQRPLANREQALHGLRGAGALHTRAQAAEEVRFRHRLGKQIALPNLAADGLELVAFV